MKRGISFKLTAAVLMYSQVIWPTLVAAQSSRGGQSVGIVTTLSGEATVLRADRPAQPLPLKFKDELYFKDRISTKQNSIARILMGGKSLVTVRELSELTVTEEPGKASFLDLFSGKIALAVAKLRMRPGETIEVRTPNAVAAVRGTVLVVEVTQATPNGEAKPRKMAFTPGATPIAEPGFNTTIHVTEGRVDVFDLGGKLRQAIPAGQTLDIFGNTFRPLRPNPPNVFAGLKGGTQHKGTPKEATQVLTGQQQGQAEALANFIAPPTLLPPTNVVISTTACEPSCASQSVVPAPGEPVVTFTGFTPSVSLNASLGRVILDSTPGASPTPPVPFSFPIPGVIDPPHLIIESNCGEGGCGPPGQILQTTQQGEGTGRITTPYFAASTRVSNGEGFDDVPVSLSGGIGLTNTSIHANGRNVFQVDRNARATIGGSTLVLTDSAISGAERVLNVDGALEGTSAAPTITMLRSHMDANDSIVRVDGTLTSLGTLISAADGNAGTLLSGGSLVNIGGTLSVGGSVLDASNEFVQAGQKLINVSGTLTSGSQALVTLRNGTQLQYGSDLLFINSEAQATLNGSVLDAADSFISTICFRCDMMTVSGTLTSNTTAPLVSITGGSLFDGGLLQVNSGGAVTLHGPLFIATNMVNLQINGPLARISAGGSLIVTGSAAPLASVAGGSSTYLLANGGPAMFDVNGSATGPVDTGAGVSLTVGTDRPLQHGGGLFQSDSASVQTSRVLNLNNALFEASAPLANLVNESVVNASNDFVNLVSQAHLSFNVPGDALVRQNASTLNVTNGSLFNVGAGSFLHVLNGSLFALNNNSGIDIVNGALVTVSGGSVFRLVNGSLGTFGPSGTNVLHLRNAPLCNAGLCVPILNTGFNILVLNGATAGNVTINPSFLVFQDLGGSNSVVIDNASDGRAILVADGSGSTIMLGQALPPSDVTILNNATVTGLVEGVDFSFEDGVFLQSGKTLKTFTGPSNRTENSPVVQITNSSVFGPGNLTQVAAGADATINGQLLVAANSAGDSITVSGDVLSILGGGRLTSNSPLALLEINGGEVHSGSSAHVFINGGTLTLVGSMLRGTEVEFHGNGSAFVGITGNGHLTVTTTASPLVDLAGGSLILGGARFLQLSGGSTATLSGGLLKTVGTTISASNTNLLDLAGASSLVTGGSLLDLDLTGTPALNLGEGAVLSLTGGSTFTKTNTATPLIRISGGSLTADLIGLNANNDADPTIRFDLSGTLLDLTNTTVQLRRLGETNPNTSGDDARFNLGTANSHIPFIRMHNTTLTLTEDGQSLVDIGNGQPGALTQNGVALISTATNPGGSVINLNGSLLVLANNGTYTLTDSDAQIQLTNTAVNQTIATPGGDSLIRVESGVTMTGQLLNSAGSTFTSPNGNFLRLVPGASLTRNSTVPNALLQFDTSTVTLGSAFTHFVQVNGNNGDGTSTTTLTLNGPAALVTSTNSALNISGSAFLEVEDGGVLNGNTTAGGVINLNGGSVTLGDNVRGLRLQGTGAMIDLPLAGALFDISNGATVTAGSGDLFIGVDTGATFTSLGGDLIKVSSGGKLIANGTDAVVGIAGGTHSISTQVGAGAAMFNLAGENTTLADPDLPGAPIGTDRPIRGPGLCPACANSKSLLFVTNATVNTNQVVKLDRALLEATFPLITVLNTEPGSAVFSISDAINLVSQAKLNAALASSIVSINAGTFTVGSGSLLNIAGGSVVNAQNLVGFSRGAILNNLFGALVTVSGGSRFNLTNAFGIGSGTINLSTNLSALSGCGSCSLNFTLIPGFAVALGAGVPSTVVTANTFTPFQGGVAATPNGIVLRVNDSASRVNLGVAR